MKNYFTKIAFAIALLATVETTAQNFIKGNDGMYPAFVSYKTNQPVFTRNKISITDETGKEISTNEVKITSEITDMKGMTHTRYQQTVNGIPVEHAMWIVHSLNGNITSQNGKLVKTFPQNLRAKALLKFSAAIEKAKAHVNARIYKWEMPTEEEFLQREQENTSATFYPKKQLVYYSGERDVTPAALRLAYKIDIYSQVPLSRKLIFVDAENGNILGEREMIHETNSNGTAVTAYSGTQNIRTDFTGTTYRLRETARSAGNGVVNTYNLLQGTNYAAATDFVDANNVWNNINAQKDEYATDAHWGAEMTYDYYLIKHNRNSYDGAGAPLNSYVHYSSNYFNAFWDGFRMTYGDGSAADNYKPLTSLDVCGHEITHAVTEYTSNLVYSYESGAMNEGFSDIFGTAIEAYARPANYDWLIGGDFYTIRSMSNPNAYSNPDTYLGTFWYSGGGDNGGVHTNSGVLNHWFYLLVNGGTGINDHGVAYNVTGIGMNDAAAIAYKLNTFYLVSTSSYADARTFGILAAENIFGSGSPQATQTANAWTAVGLYGATCSTVTNLAVSNITEYSASISWDAVPGSVYYLVQYKASTDVNWISIPSVTTNSASLSGLNASTIYDWRVKASCSSGYSTAQFTTTPVPCNPVTGLAATINGTTVLLEWNTVYQGISYHLEYKPDSSGAWIDGGWLTTSSQTLTGLLNNTLYNWRITMNCGSDTSGSSASTFLTDAPSCGIPTNLNVVYSSGLTTTLNWDAVPGATAYQVQVKWYYATWDNESQNEIVTTNSKTYVGFGSGFNLDWRVRAICLGNLSTWVVSNIATPCPGPTALSATTVSSNSAVLGWTASGANSVNGIDVDYKLSTTTTWTHLTYIPTQSTSYTLSGLLQGRTYDVRIKQDCMSQNSAFVQTTFSTTCSNPPSLLSATEIKTNSAKISWTGAPGSSLYSLQYKKSTSSTWTTVSSIATTNYTLTGLTANTVYNYKVSASCATGTTAYSTQSSFTTYCTSSGSNSQEWIDLFSFGSINRTSGADAGGYVHTSLSTNATVGVSYSGIISAGFSGATRNENFAVYVDLNKNGSYADAGERLVGPIAFNTAGNVNFTLTVPAGASEGIASMRVVMLRTPTSMAPCLTGNRGETEDYFINISASPTFAETISQPNSSMSSSSKFDYAVYPNPSSGVFKVECVDCNSISRYELMTINGAIMENKTVDEKNELMLDISNYAQGIYFLKINDMKGNMQVLKIVKE